MRISLLARKSVAVNCELYVKLDSRELDFLNDRLVVLKLIQNFVIDIAAVRFISFDLVDDQFTPLP